MGRQSFIAFVSITTTAVLSSSMYLAVMRFIGETAGRGREELLPGLLWWAWRVEGIAAVLGGGTLAVWAILGASPQGAWAFAAVVTAAGILHSVPTAVLIGLQQFRRASVVGLTTGLVGTIAVTLVLWQGGGITGMFATEAVVGVLNLLWTGALARRSLSAVERRVQERPRQSELRGLRRAVGRFALLSSIGLFLELIVGTRSEFFFLAHYSTDAEIAFYGSPHQTAVNFPVTQLGVLPGPNDLAKLYGEATVGIAFSTTNPSLVPYEMMACGLPVLDLGREGNEMNYSGRFDIARLANPDPVAMAQELSDLIGSPTELASGAWSGTGVLGPEAFDPVPFLDLLTAYGSPWGMR